MQVGGAVKSGPQSVGSCRQRYLSRNVFPAGSRQEERTPQPRVQ